MARVVGEVRPRYVVLENVANLLTIKKGLVWQEVIETLAALGFDVVWDCIPAAAVGAPHRRDRVFAVAVANDDEPRADAHAAAGGSWPATGERVGDVAAYTDGTDGERNPSQRRVENGRPNVGGSHQGASDTMLQGLEGRGLDRFATERAAAPADANGRRCEAVAKQDKWSPGRESASFWDDTDERGVRVEWENYKPAIQRWETIHGSAPAPLVRRMDDRSAARVERSRLSALGDGVQVQVGHIVGEYVTYLEQQRKQQQKERVYA